MRVDPTGTVTVFTGSHSHGQGHETTFAQIVADELGIPMEQIEVVHGDTARIPFGMGTYGSRSACVGGSAIVKCLDKIKEKGRKIAAHLLEAGEQDLVFQGGTWSVKGSPDKKKAWGEVALMAYLAHNIPQGMEPGLEATSFYDPVNFTFPFGAHVAVVEVDAETGAVTILKYVAVDDVGRVINPMIVDGMVHGGIAQGVGQALWEHGIYTDDGQLLSGTMMDYAMPKADSLPSYVTDRTVTPSPINRDRNDRLDAHDRERGHGRARALRGQAPRHAAHAGQDLEGRRGRQEEIEGGATPCTPPRSSTTRRRTSRKRSGCSAS